MKDDPKGGALLALMRIRRVQSASVKGMSDLIPQKEAEKSPEPVGGSRLAALRLKRRDAATVKLAVKLKPPELSAEAIEEPTVRRPLDVMPCGHHNFWLNGAVCEGCVPPRAGRKPVFVYPSNRDVAKRVYKIDHVLACTVERSQWHELWEARYAELVAAMNAGVPDAQKTV